MRMLAIREGRTFPPTSPEPGAGPAAHTLPTFGQFREDVPNPQFSSPQTAAMSAFSPMMPQQAAQQDSGSQSPRNLFPWALDNGVARETVPGPYPHAQRYTGYHTNAFLPMIARRTQPMYYQDHHGRLVVPWQHRPPFAAQIPTSSPPSELDSTSTYRRQRRNAIGTVSDDTARTQRNVFLRPRAHRDDFFDPGEELGNQAVLDASNSGARSDGG